LGGLVRFSAGDDVSPVGPVRTVEADLERRMFGLRRLVADRAGVSVADSLRMELQRQVDGMAVELSGFVLAERLPPVREVRSATVVFEVPASWWQHLKATVRGWRWCRRVTGRWQVAVRVVERRVELSVELQRWWTFPKATVQVPELGRPVRVSELSVSLIERY
jgi:hypothetical protein